MPTKLQIWVDKFILIEASCVLTNFRHDTICTEMVREQVTDGRCRTDSNMAIWPHDPLRSQMKLLLFPTPIDMADDRQQSAKESKGIRNRLKKAIGLESRSMQSRRSHSPSTVSAPPVVTAPPAAPTPAVIIDPGEAAKLRAKYTRFRILVIGRANAGKTTLLKRVCNTTEEPSIYDKDKNLVSYRLIVISHSHRFFINSSNRPQRCRLGDFCTYPSWLQRCSGGSMIFAVHSLSRATQGSSSMTLLDLSMEEMRNSRLLWLSFKSAWIPRKLIIKSMSSGMFLLHTLMWFRW